MDNADAFENTDIKRLLIFLYLVPVFGFFPAAWTLYSRRGDRPQRVVSRLSLTLTLAWVIGYSLLGTGAQAMATNSGTSPVGATSLLLLSGLLTSSYFLTNLWLMVRFWQHQPLKLPWFSQVAKHLP